ncbi:MAG: exodeoxyribonuclease III, partial [Pseudomonadota bacterium]
MKLATWNINSLKVRLPHVLDWVSRHQPDVLCLQETKLEDAKFPNAALHEAGYSALVSGQKTYNGVAILSRSSALEPLSGIPGFDDDHKRAIAATISGVRIVCLYVPNGENIDTPKYEYKMRWLAAARAWLQEELARYPRLAVVGDFNIAPEPEDVHDPALWETKIHFTQPERDALKSLFALGLKDSFRLFDQPERSYTWWDYRMMAFRRKMGLRIDHILLSAELSGLCKSCTIDIEPRR